MLRFFIAFTLVACSFGGNPRKPLKKYTINLDLAPEERFKEVVLDHKEAIKVLVQVLRVLFSSSNSKKFLDAVHVPEEHRREMTGIATALNLTYEEALMANFFYELSDCTDNLPEEWRSVASRSCTGIVAEASNGTIMHARNQDYPPPFAVVEYDGTFMKDGKVLFEGTSFAGTIGIGGTCMVPGKWSAEINARKSYGANLEEAIDRVSKGYVAFPTLLRQGCEHGGDFDAGLKYLSETPMITSGYFTIAGAAPGEGAILTRNFSGTDTDVLRLSNGRPALNPWFLIQTNYDHWKQPPKYDDRRDNGIKSMEAVGPENLSLDALWGVMSTTGAGTGSVGVYNPATIHTELIIPATGEYHTYLRHDIIDHSSAILV